MNVNSVHKVMEKIEIRDGTGEGMGRVSPITIRRRRIRRGRRDYKEELNRIWKK